MVPSHNPWLSVNGEDGTSGSFEGLSLHPNFQIANILFNYNRSAVWNTMKIFLTHQ